MSAQHAIHPENMPAADSSCQATTPEPGSVLVGMIGENPCEGTASPSGEPEPWTSRLEAVIGAERVARLTDSCVMVLGLGGVGSNCLEALARGGVGKFILVDCDAVSTSNINRQAVAWTSTVGKRKVDVARSLVLGINPDASVRVYDLFLNTDNVGDFLRRWAGRVDYIVDAVDTVSAKVEAAVTAHELGIPLVSCMGTARKLYPEQFRFADIYETAVDPLCRVVRHELRKREIPALTVLYSEERPAKLPDAMGQKATENSPLILGSMSYVPPVAGMMLAGYVIRQLVGIQ